MTEPEYPVDPRVENTMIREALRLTAQALQTYHDAPHFELDDDGVEKSAVIVPAAAREKAAEGLARAEPLLTDMRGKSR